MVRFAVDRKSEMGDPSILDDPSHVVSLFYGLSQAAAQPVSRLLFFYGWNSYVVFENGKAVARGDEQ